MIVFCGWKRSLGSIKEGAETAMLQISSPAKNDVPPNFG